MRPKTVAIGVLAAFLAVSITYADVPSVYPPSSIYKFPASVLGRATCLPLDGGCTPYLRWYDNGQSNGPIGGTYEAFQGYEYAVTTRGFPPSSRKWNASGFYQIHIYDVPHVTQMAESKRIVGHLPPDAVNASERMQGGYNFQVASSTKSCNDTDGWIYRNISLSISIDAYPFQPPCTKSSAWMRTASHALYNATVAYATAHPTGE